MNGTDNVSELSLEEAFNVIVNLARDTKLTYKEHRIVDDAVQRVLDALNSIEVKEEPKEEQKTE